MRNCGVPGIFVSRRSSGGLRLPTVPQGNVTIDLPRKASITTRASRGNVMSARSSLASNVATPPSAASFNLTVTCSCSMRWRSVKLNRRFIHFPRCLAAHSLLYPGGRARPAAHRIPVRLRRSGRGRRCRARPRCLPRLSLLGNLLRECQARRRHADESRAGCSSSMDCREGSHTLPEAAPASVAAPLPRRAGRGIQRRFVVYRNRRVN